MVDPYDGTINGGYDVFVAAIAADGGFIVHSTFLGGNATDAAWDIALDGSGNAYITGETWSSDFPTLNAYDNSLSSAPDAFVARFAAEPVAVPALSEWAMIILTLLVTSAATVGVIRRRKLGFESIG